MGAIISLLPPVQDLTRRNEQLRADITALERRNEQLRGDITALKNRIQHLEQPAPVPQEIDQAEVRRVKMEKMETVRFLLILFGTIEICTKSNYSFSPIFDSIRRFRLF